jgi:hypothetical protein
MQIWENDPVGLFKLTRGLALCLGSADHQKYAEQAMEALHQAAALGFGDVVKIADDTSVARLTIRGF